MKTQTILTILIVFMATSCKEELSNSDTVGDNISDVGEECDGENIGNSSCQSLGFYGGLLTCNSSCQLDMAGCVADGYCGDDVQQFPTEECDGVIPEYISCQTLGYPGATLACGDNCRYDIVGCEGAEVCGNNVINTSEECDGIELDGESCQSRGLGFIGGTLTCANNCRFDYSGCYSSVACGDGFLQDGEECDGQALGGATCANIGFTGGTLPVRGGIVLVLTKMDRIIDIDTENLMAEVEPGVVTAELQRQVEKLGLFYPLDPASR